MFNVLVIASGRGSRLQEVLGNLPKCLVPVAGRAAILRQYEYWSKQEGFGRMVLITHSAELVKSFLHLNNVTDIDVISHEKFDGSANAIAQAPQSLTGLPCVIHWCDVLLTEPFKNFGFFNYCITCEGYGRYEVRDGRIEPVKDGNVCGIYALHSFRRPAKHLLQNEPDFADIANTYDNWRELKRPDLVNFGDMPQLCQANAGLSTTKSNKDTSIALQDGVLIKTGRACEAPWFEKAERKGIATPYLTNNGKDIWLAYATRGTVWSNRHNNEVIERFGELQSKLIRLETGIRIEVDYEQLVLHRITKRLHPAMFELSGIDKSSYTLLARGIAKALHSLTNGLESATHGHFDMHMHNAVVDEHGRVLPIDPGGDTYKWGKLGPLGYETGKMLYAYYIWSGLYENEPTQCWTEAKYAPDWLKANKLAKLWCASHLLACPRFFAMDFVRLRFAMQQSYAIAKTLLETSSNG